MLSQMQEPLYFAEDIGRIAIANGWESYIAFGKINSDIVSQLKQKL